MANSAPTPAPAPVAKTSFLAKVEAFVAAHPKTAVVAALVVGFVVGFVV